MHKATWPLYVAFFIIVLPIMGYTQLAIGPKFGGGVSSVQDIEGEFPNIPGVVFSYQAGAIAQKNLSKRWALQAELSYIRKGFEVAEQGLAFNRFFEDADYVLDYAALDVSSKFFLVSKQDIDWYVLAGPYVSVMFTGSFQGKEGFVGLSTPFNEPLSYGENGFSRFDAGVNIGLGGQFDLGVPWFFAELRYTQGFTDILNVGQGTIRNYSLMGQFGWIFYLDGDR